MLFISSLRQKINCSPNPLVYCRFFLSLPLCVRFTPWQKMPGFILGLGSPLSRMKEGRCALGYLSEESLRYPPASWQPIFKSTLGHCFMDYSGLK